MFPCGYFLVSCIPVVDIYYPLFLLRGGNYESSDIPVLQNIS